MEGPWPSREMSWAGPGWRQEGPSRGHRGASWQEAAPGPGRVGDGRTRASAKGAAVSLEVSSEGPKEDNDTWR